MKRHLREYYEKEGENRRRYDSESFWDSRYHRKRMNRIISILRSYGRINTFLDSGCGTGEYVSEAVKFCNKPIGLDISSTYLKNAKKVRRDLSLIQADAQLLPFRDKSIEYILCSETLEHLPSPESALLEISRVARKGLVISTPNYGILRAATAKVAGSSVKRLDESVGHVNVMTLLQLREKILNKGCKIKTAMTLHVTPPIVGERLRLSPKFSFIIDKCEVILNKILPKSGNISLIECEFF